MQQALPLPEGLDPAEAVAAAIQAVRAESSVIPFARRSKRLQRHAAKREKPEGPIPVVFYGRLSRNRDGSITGLDRQEAETIGWAKTMKFEVIARHTDDDLSAFSMKKPRPGFDAAMEAVRSGPARGIIVWKLDRLVRRVIEWSQVLPESEKTPWFVASHKESINTSDPFGRLIANILVAMAELESSNISVRSRSKHSEIAKEGRWSGGGTRAYGHNHQRTEVIESEAENIREVAERLLRRETLFGIAADMERRGVVGPGAGKPMQAATWRRILLSPRMAGKRVNDDGELSPAGMPPILDEDTMRRVWGILDRPSGSQGHGNARVHLFSGLLECGNCGGPLRAWRTRGKLAYACLQVPGSMGCGACSVTWDDEAEAVMVKVALKHLERLELATFARRDDHEAERLLAAVRREDAALEDLAMERFAAPPRITDIEFQAARTPILVRREDLVRKLHALTPRAPLAGGRDVHDAWAAWSFAERRTALEASFEKIVVGPGFAERAQRADGEPHRNATRRLRPVERLSPVLRSLRTTARPRPRTP